MKKITELTEQEIYALTDEQIDTMVKLNKAENGVKFIPQPRQPDYLTENEKDCTVYGCEIFEDRLVFQSIEELNTVLALIRKSTTKGRLEYDWNKLGNDYKWFESGLKKKYSYSGDPLEVNTQSCFSLETYTKTVDVARHNKTLKETYSKEIKEYKDSLKDNKWIEDEIWDKVRAVRDKFWTMQNLARKFKYDYLPIAENNETVAMGFLDKAYSLTEEQKEYIMANYQGIN